MSIAARSPPRGRSLAAAWQFGRPHTVVGTTISVCAVFVLALLPVEAGLASALWSTGPLSPGLALLLGSLCAALAANVFIVGLNQLRDLPLDRINKPRLPLPSGALGVTAARRLVAAAGVVAVVVSASLGWWLAVTVIAGMAIGYAYSVPPMHLKRFGLAAAVSIAAVRGPIVNLGLYAHFRSWAGAPIAPSAGIILLTSFMTVFAVAIAVAKDIPDVAGDRAHRIGTVAALRGPETAHRLTLALLATAFGVGAVVAMVAVEGAPGLVLCALHGAAAVLVLRAGRHVDAGSLADVKGFYRLVWRLFYAEYLIVPAILVGSALS